MGFEVTAIDHVVLNVSDVERSVEWYVRLLGMRREDWVPPRGGESRVSLMFGQQKINLRPMTATQGEWFTGVHPQPGSDDLCFLTDSTPEEVVAQCRRCDVPVVTGPVVKRGARGAIQSVYVRDPDGNLIEIATYRPATG